MVEAAVMDPIHAALLAERDTFIEAMLVEVPAAVPFYALVPREAQRAMATRLVDLYLDALVTFQPDAIRAFGTEVFTRRQQQGASLVDVLRGVTVGRRAFARITRRTLPTIELAERALDRVEDLSTELSEAAVSVYEHRFDAQQSAIAALEARYQERYQCTPAMMHSLDHEGRLSAVSDRWLETLGYTRDEVLGRRSTEFLTETSRKSAAEAHMPRVRQEGRVYDVPLQYVKKNGDVLDACLSAVVLRDESGAVQEYLGVFEDVTAELKATRALRESEERWRALIELAPLPLAVHRDGLLLWVNDALARLVGAPREQIVGMNVMSLIHPDDRALLLERMRMSRELSIPLDPIEERYVRADGVLIYAEVAARPILYEGAPATQIAVVDVTARRQAEEARHQNEAQARLLQTQEETLRALSTPLIPIGDGVLVSPLIGRFTYERATSFLETLAAGVVAQGARVAIVDVTGVPEADASVAEALVRAAQTIRLLGAEVVITGIQPPIARALVEIGAELGSLTTRGTLRDGIRYALRGSLRRRA